MSRHWFTTVLTILSLATLAAATPELTFQTAGDNLIITATEDDGSQDFWQMDVQISGVQQGRIVGFYDLTDEAGSDATYNYTNNLKCGLFASMDGNILGQSISPFVVTPGTAIDGQTSYTYTMTAIEDHNGGVRTRTSVITIHAPTADGTLIEASNTWHFNADNLGGLDRDVVQKANLVLTVSDATGAGNEYAATAMGLTTSDLSTGDPYVEVAVNSGVAQMTAGRTFRLTSIGVNDGLRAPGDTSYNYADASYDNYGSAVMLGTLNNGASDERKGRSAAGECTYASAATLEISITSESNGGETNLAPIVSAGTDQQHYLPILSADLIGSVSDDDLPDPPALLTIGWSKASGPGTVSFTDETNPVTTATFSEGGVYELELSAYDGEYTRSDIVVISLIDSPVLNAYYVDQNHPSASNSNDGSEASPWLTINYAVGQVGPGDTIYVKEGIYRESVKLVVDGTETMPITLTTYGDDRVVISGAKEIDGWMACDTVIAKGNANAASMYYVDLTWEPTVIYQDGVPMDYGREPDVGWWVVDTAQAGVINDATNLTAPAGTWTGGTAFIWNVSDTQMALAPIVSDTPGELTVTGLKFTPEIPDRYFIRNMVELIDHPGECAIEDMGGTYRVYVWPADNADPNTCLMEAPTDTIAGTNRYMIELFFQGWWIIDGFEVRHGISRGIGTYKEAIGNIVIQNCSVHHILGDGFYLNNIPAVTIRRCYVGHNGMGDLGGGGIILLNGCSDILIEECEVDSNAKDGIKIHGAGNILRHNYVHGQWFYQHADNLQTSGVDSTSDTLVEDCFVLNGGQNYMLEGMTGLTIANSVFAGCRSNSIVFNDDDLTLTSNTLAFTGAGPLDTNVSDGNDGFAFSDNIFMPGHLYPCFGMNSTSTFTSDYNLFFFGEGYVDTDWRIAVYDGNWASRGLAEYQSDSGQEANSLYGDPMFVNAPGRYNQLDIDRLAEFTETKVYIDPSYASDFAVGDHIEIDWDGVVRTLTAIGSDYLEFTPGDPRVRFKATVVANWGEATDFTLDFTPAVGSPALGNGSGGGNIGSSIDTAAMIAGDYDSDGLRDIPAWIEDPNAVAARVLGDVNGDDVINLDDFIILKQNYGQSPANWADGDFNDDNIVNLDDFIILKQYYGQTVN